MATTPITLDMSTAQPIKTVAPTAPVTLDMSTAQPLNQAGSASAPVTAPATPGLLDYVPGARLAEGVLSGVGGAALQTVQGAKNLANKVLPQSMQIPDIPKEYTENTTIPEKIGGAAETIGEYAVGDEALQGVLKGAGIIARTHPALARAVIQSALRGTAVGAVEGGVKGAATGQGEKGAIEGAIAGGSSGAAAEALPAVVGGVRAVKNVVAPSEDIAQQVTKDAIKKVLGSKADADVVADAASRLEPQGILSKHLSNVENELKLVKPKVDAELVTNNAALDKTLANSTAKVTDAAHEVNKTFDAMVSDANAGVGDKDEAVKAINDVRARVIAKLQNGDTGVQDINDVKRLVGNEIKKFSAPDNLTSTEKVEQEAYRQSYFKLRDLVSQAEPATKDLNEKISRGIDLQNLLEKKFPHLETAEQAEASHAGVVSQKAKDLGKTVTKAAGLGTAGTAAGAAGIAGYEYLTK